MLIENEFRATAPVEDLWSFLLDVERIAPCMPGAELTETVDERTWKGRVSMKFGPVAMSFAGTVTMREREDDAHRVVLAAKGTEQKGKGAASATVTSWLEPNDDGTSIVKMRADISLTGAAAQLSRGLLPEVSKKLTQQFADCLEQTLAATGVGDRAPGSAMAGPAGDAPSGVRPAAGAGDGVSATREPATVPSAPQPAPVAPPASTAPPPATAQREAATASMRPTTARPPAEPVGGIRLALGAIWAVLRNLVARLLGGLRRA